MTRRFGLIAGLLLLGCAPQARVVPAPEPAPAAAAPVPDPAANPVPPASDLSLARTVTADTAALHRLADSAQDQTDMELLERLREADAAPADSAVTAEVDLTELFDINVARYAEHQRVRYYLDFFQGPARERMAVWLERLPVYEPMIREALLAHNLPRDLTYLALIESGYSNTAVSRSKAVGMWQFMRPTAKEYGMRIDRWVDERRDPIKATNAAARFLADLTKRFGGSHYLAAAAYNSGGGTVSRGLRKLGAGADEDYFGDVEVETELAEDLYGDDRFFHLSESRFLRRETKDYVPKLIAAAMIAKQPEKYGFPAIPKVEPYAVDSVPVTEPTGLEAVARVTGLDTPSIAALNPQLLRGITPPTVGTSWIRVPVGYGIRATEGLAALTPDERLPSGTHVVKRRETLRSIGKRYGLSPTELAGFNPDLDPKIPLKAGTRLRIPGTSLLRSYAAADRADDASGRSRGWHTVRRGETVSGIARQYRMSQAQLRAMNELSTRSVIKVGQRLRVLGRGGAKPTASKTSKSGPTVRKTKVAEAAAASVHLVRRGDTLSGLARRYGVSVKELMTANQLRSAENLKAGVRLKIPS